MRIILIHGFNVLDAGASTVDKLRPFLEAAGHEVESDSADYGYYKLWMIRFRKHSAVIRVVNALATADAVIAHSNGWNYLMKALRFILFRRIIVIALSGAGQRNPDIPDSVERGWIFHTRTDFWVWVSGFLPWLGWGRMGQRGYSGDDPRITNIDFSDTIADHSDWFKDDTIEFTANQIIKVLSTAEGST